MSVLVQAAAWTGSVERFIGADISWMQQQQDEGIRFADHGKRNDLLAILKDHGFNAIRLRIFHNPKTEKGYSKQGYEIDRNIASLQPGK